MLIITVAVVIKAMIAPGDLATWLPLFAPVVAVTIAVNLATFASVAQAARERRRAARLAALVASEPELFGRLGTRRAALLRGEDGEA